MTKEEFKTLLKEHNFKTFNEFIEFVNVARNVSMKDKCDLLAEENTELKNNK